MVGFSGWFWAPRDNPVPEPQSVQSKQPPEQSKRVVDGMAVYACSSRLARTYGVAACMAAQTKHKRQSAKRAKPADHNGSISLEDFNNAFKDDDYAHLSRGQLQFQCEALGINAKQKSEMLRAALRSASDNYDMDEEIDSEEEVGQYDEDLAQC